ncbi:hypothetical protein OSB04_028898 [Centaurea solstitialis]|uniref:F-box domain-containing protein n=1 Tax=Centaurea solstitialis TaxID=347529 RepID=A0AA38VY90_9ASTR|nr:hypothetical protein OSB04_028898 [Centaurea solstitialis]
MSTCLPFDIQVEIMKRLPVQSLILFRSVCKAWDSLIKTKEVESVSSVDDEKKTQDRESLSFVDDEKETDDQESVSSVDDEKETEDRESVSSIDDEEETEERRICCGGTSIIGGSHGLLCLSDHLGDPNDTAETQTAVVWNPAIRKSVAVDVPNMLYTINQPNASIEWVLGFRESGEPIIEVQDDIMDPTSTLGVYDPCLQHIKDLGICGDNLSFSGSSYTISLLLLDHVDHGQIIRCGDVKR